MERKRTRPPPSNQSSVLWDRPAMYQCRREDDESEGALFIEKWMWWFWWWWAEENGGCGIDEKDKENRLVPLSMPIPFYFCGNYLISILGN